MILRKGNGEQAESAHLADTALERRFRTGRILFFVNFQHVFQNEGLHPIWKFVVLFTEQLNLLFTEVIQGQRPLFTFNLIVLRVNTDFISEQFSVQVEIVAEAVAEVIFSRSVVIF